MMDDGTDLDIVVGDAYGIPPGPALEPWVVRAAIGVVQPLCKLRDGPPRPSIVGRLPGYRSRPLTHPREGRSGRLPGGGV
jgi:hypothetical protein